MKFGGTSVEDATAIARVADIVARHLDLRPVVVVSAMSRMTDALLAAVEIAWDGDELAAVTALDAHLERHLDVARALLSSDSRAALLSRVERARGELGELLHSLSGRLMSLNFLRDVVVSYGERLSAALLAAVLRERGIRSTHVDARRCITTSGEHGNAIPVIDETNRRTRSELAPLIEKEEVPVLGGFMGATVSGETTTLGRGGSDYTASLVGAALQAREIQIWTDVTGVLTADPRLVSKARTISRLSYAEAAELAYFGAKVLHPKTIQPAVEWGIPVRVCNSRTPDEAGTVIGTEKESSPHTVKAIAHKKGITVLQVTSARMLGAYGFLHALFEVFNRHQTAVDVVTTSEVSVSLSLDDTRTLPEIVKELQELGSVRVDERLAMVCIVGEGISHTPGIAARVFSTISDINVSLISQGASSINLTFVVEEAHVHEAVSRLHQTFFEEAEEQVAVPRAFARSEV
jgi:aspartate kinase